MLHLASEYSRSRDSVCLRLVRIVSDTSVSALVSTRESNKTSWSLATATGDLKLVAAGVELSTRVRVGGVQRDDLVADEVVAGGNALGDGVGDDTAGLHEGCGAPGVGCAGAAGLLDLEADGTTES